MFSFLNAAVKYSNNTENVQDTFMVCCIISVIVMAALTVVVIAVLSMMFNELKTLKKELEIIGYVKQESVVKRAEKDQTEFLAETQDTKPWTA